MSNTDNNELFGNVEEMDNLNDFLDDFGSDLDTNNLFNEETSAKDIDAEEDDILKAFNESSGVEEDGEFMNAMNEHLRNMEAGDISDNDLFVDNRAREAAKKLPEWSLEPPYSL